MNDPANPFFFCSRHFTGKEYDYSKEPGAEDDETPKPKGNSHGTQSQNGAHRFLKTLL
jgi:hypothetical protein